MTWAGGLYIRTPFTPKILHLSQRCHGVCGTRFVGIGGDDFDGCWCGMMVCWSWGVILFKSRLSSKGGVGCDIV